MKTQVKHPDRHHKLGYFLFGLVVTLFTFIIVYNFIEQRRVTYTGTSISSLIGKNLTTPVSNPITEAQPFDLRELLTAVDEPALVVDQWMTDLASWNVATLPGILTEEFVEEQIAMESWMFNLSTWTSPIFVELPEPLLEVEPWMLSTSTWANLSFLNTNIVEQELAVENWMLSTDTWNTSIDLSVINWVDTPVEEAQIIVESWMIDVSSFITSNELFQNNMSFMEEEIAIETWMLNLDDWKLHSSSNYTAIL